MTKQNFRESEHPRGQPGNRGQFAPKPSVQADTPAPPTVDLSGVSFSPISEGAQTVELSEYVGHDDLLRTKDTFQHMLQEDIVPSFLESEPSLDQDELDALDEHLSNDYQNDEWVEDVVKTAYINAIADAIEDVDITGEPSGFDSWRSSDQRAYLMEMVEEHRLIDQHLETIAETDLAEATVDFTSKLPRYNS